MIQDDSGHGVSKEDIMPYMYLFERSMTSTLSI